MKSGIYIIINPVGKKYVGQSSNVDRRIKEYKRLKNCNQQRLLYNSLMKYGINQHIFSVLEYCEIISLNDREVFYMSKHNCLDRNHGLNIREGGSSGKHSEETKRKISIGNKGKKRSVKVLKKMSEYKKANPTKYWKGKKRSDHVVKRLRESNIGNSNKSIWISQFTKDGLFIADHHGAENAAKSIGKKSGSAIRNNINGQSKSAYGFVWSIKK